MVRATRARFACASAFVLGLVVFGRTVLGVFGPEFVSGYTTLVLLSLAQLVRAAGGPVAELLGVTGHQDESLRVCAVGLVATVALSLVLVPMYGIVGAGWSVLFVTTGSMVWLNALCVRRLGIVPSILGRIPRA